MKLEININFVDAGNDIYYCKDSQGIVWQLIKTPYKELPIYNLEKPKNRKNELSIRK